MLLSGDDAAPDSLTAKVADFGLARDFGTATRVQAAKYGTITHMPPELLTDGSLTKASRSEPAPCVVTWTAPATLADDETSLRPALPSRLRGT